MDTLERRLESERRDSDEARLRLEEASRERSMAGERAEAAEAERRSSDRARRALAEEVERLTQENQLLNDALDRSVKESRGAKQTREQVESHVEKNLVFKSFFNVIFLHVYTTGGGPRQDPPRRDGGEKGPGREAGAGG